MHLFVTANINTFIHVTRRGRRLACVKGSAISEFGLLDFVCFVSVQLHVEYYTLDDD